MTDHCHPDYNPAFCELMRAAYKGEDAVKETGYLVPPPSISNDKKDIEYFVKLAEYPDVVKRTVNALVARAFSKPYEIDDDVIDLDSLDVSGRRFSRFLRYILTELSLTGLVALVADYDANGDPKIAAYRCEALLDWARTDGQYTYIALDESYDDFDTTNLTRERVEKRRVYAIDDAGVYTSTLLLDKTTGDFVEDEKTYLSGATGNLEKLPVFFLGEPGDDDSLMEPLVKLALKYMETSALYRFGQAKLLPTVWRRYGPSLFDMEEGDDGSMQITEIRLGSSNVIQLEPEGDIGILAPQASGFDYYHKDFERYTAQMIALGARAMMDPSKTQISTDTMRMQSSGESTTLAELVGGLEDDINAVFECLGEMSGRPFPVLVMNKDFFDQPMTAQDITAYTQSVMAGAMPQSVFNQALRKSGLTKLEDGEIYDEINGDM